MDQPALFTPPERREDEPMCRACGCTEDQACSDPTTLLGTCFWVADDLCSACWAPDRETV